MLQFGPRNPILVLCVPKGMNGEKSCKKYITIHYSSLRSMLMLRLVVCTTTGSYLPSSTHNLH